MFFPIRRARLTRTFGHSFVVTVKGGEQMALRIFSLLCLVMSLVGTVPVLLNPGIKEHVALILFGIAMVFMAMGFGYVSRALSKISGAPIQK